MDSILLEIQETVRKYADIMSQVALVDVEIVDDNLFRVAGTGMFAGYVNEDMSSEGYVYRQILKTGSGQVIYNPGKEPICQKCPKRHSCREEIEISMPLHLDGQVIGAIGLVGSDREQKERILENEKMYSELISQIREFIEVKAAELIESRRRESLVSALEYTINHMDQGVLILGEGDIITSVNDSARQQLGIQTPVGQRLEVKDTGDKMGGQIEYQITIETRSLYAMGNIYSLLCPTKHYRKILVFTGTRDIHKKMYEMTATVISGHMIGSSRKTNDLKREIEKIAKSTSTVLITGESGTGKEMAATAIWRAGDRRDKRFVAINCAAIPEPLLESELFGYVKGAFTGADPSGRIGKFELADKGVIFLDEIGDMPLYLQGKLLRVLQERNITRIGSNQLIPIDLRVIAATNKDLKAMMNRGKFREDLYYRLNVIPLKIPPLRERREDIGDLAHFFAVRYAGLFGKNLRGIGDETMEALKAHPWYGNVRELENTIEFMVNMIGDDGVLDNHTLPVDFFGEEREQPAKPVKPERESPKAIRPLKELERQEIERAFKLLGNDTRGKRMAAQQLGIGLATLYRRLEEFSL